MWTHIKQICYKQNDLTFNPTSQPNGDNFAIIQSLCRPQFLLCVQAPRWCLPRHFGNDLIHKTKEKPVAKKKKHTCIENVQARKFRIGGRTMKDVSKDLMTNFFKTFPPKLFNLLCMHQWLIHVRTLIPTSCTYADQKLKYFSYCIVYAKYWAKLLSKKSMFLFTNSTHKY